MEFATLEMFDARCGKRPPYLQPFSSPRLKGSAHLHFVLLTPELLTALEGQAKAAAAGVAVELEKIREGFRTAEIYVRLGRLRAKLQEREARAAACEAAARQAQAEARTALAQIEDPTEADGRFRMATMEKQIAEGHCTHLRGFIAEAERQARQELRRLLDAKAAELRAIASAMRGRIEAEIAAFVAPRLVALLSAAQIEKEFAPRHSMQGAEIAMERLSADLPNGEYPREFRPTPEQMDEALQRQKAAAPGQLAPTA